MRAKPESTITSYKSRASNLIVLVESVIKLKILHKNIEKREQEPFLKKKCARKMIVLLLAICRGISDHNGKRH